MTTLDLASAILRLKLGITPGTEPVTTVRILSRDDIQAVLTGLYEESRRADRAEKELSESVKWAAILDARLNKYEPEMPDKMRERLDEIYGY